MITLHNISFYRGPRTIFDGISLTLATGHKVGLIGKNGCGKTTFLQILLGHLTPDVGTISSINGLTLAHLDQETPDSDETCIEYVVAGDKELVDIEKRLAQAEYDEDYETVINLHTRLADIDGYSARARAAKLLSGLGFSDDMQQSPLNALSGGWRMRLKLARILMSRAELLLLDEPTNHLDLNAVAWLERWLQQYNGNILLISHDRDFLDSVVDQTLHIHRCQMKLYNGNYTEFETQRALSLQVQEAMYKKQQVHIAHLEKFISRFRYKASKATQAQSRIKALERLPLIAAVQNDSEFHFEFFEPKRCPSPLVKLENVKLGYSDEPLFYKLNLQIESGQRIGLIGPNGEGKSTVLKALAGELSLMSGARVVDSKLPFAYFTQEQLAYLHAEESALLHMEKLAPGERQQTLRDYLGKFGFSHDLALAPAGQYSGGEKSRLVLAMLIWQRPALLLLDEPTNHLDLEMRNALSLALQDYTGAVVVISHDRYLLRSCVNELWLVNDKKVVPFDGDISEYQRWCLSS